MKESRECSRAQCSNPAVATMTFSYQQARAVLGGLSAQPISGALDLCAEHAEKVTVPVGWEMVMLKKDCEKSSRKVEEERSSDGLTALALALAEADEAAKAASANRPASANRHQYDAYSAVSRGNAGSVGSRNDLGSAGVASNANGMSESIGDIPNPWISRVEIPQRSRHQRPQLRVIDGGKEE